MKHGRGLVKVLISCLLVVLLIAGCGGNGNAGNSNSAEGNGAGKDAPKASGTNSQNTETADDGAFRIYDPPIEITTAIALRDSDKLLNGDTLENNPLSRWAKDNLGVIVKYKWQMTDQGDAMKQKIRLAMASGEELPDVLNVGDAALLNDLIDSGEIEPVGDAFDKYATPRTKEAFEKNASVWLGVTKDGKRWALPQISDGFVGDPVMWIRQDWLDAVGMKAPTNLDEFEQVLAAFKEKFPDKTPWSIAGKSNFSGYMGDAQFIFGQNQITIWDKDGNGGLQYGSLQPTVKQALTKLDEYYKKGYLDPDFGTYEPDKASSQFTAGNAGIIFGPGWMGGWPLSDTMKNVDGAVVKPYPLPSGIDGTVGRIGSPLSYSGYVFRKGFDHFDAIFQYWDAMLGVLLEDPDSPFANGYAEGYDYIMKDGQPDWKDAPGSSPINYRLLSPGNQPPGMVQGDNIYQRVLDGKQDTVYERKLAEMTKNGDLSLQGKAVTLSQMEADHRNLAVGPPTKTKAEKGDLLYTLESETFLGIVYGKESPDAFDKFVKDWKAKGGDQLTKEVNDWYKSTQ